MKSVSLLSYNIFSQDINQILSFNQQSVINTINAYSFVIAEKNKQFKKALQSSDVLLPDGFPIVLAARILKKQKIQKIAGADIHNQLLKTANKRNKKVFYLGSSPKTLKKIEFRLRKEYPNIKLGCYSPPYKQKFSSEDNNQIIKSINSFEPDMVFVGMTAPKQEIWVNNHKNELNAKIICCIGAVFDFYAGTVKRAPNWMIKIKLEWFYRLIKEPKRMWKRYLIYSPLFFLYLFREFVGINRNQ